MASRPQARRSAETPDGILSQGPSPSGGAGMRAPRVETQVGVWQPQPGPAGLRPADPTAAPSREGRDRVRTQRQLPHEVAGRSLCNWQIRQAGNITHELGPGAGRLIFFPDRLKIRKINRFILPPFISPLKCFLRYVAGSF